MKSYYIFSALLLTNVVFSTQRVFSQTATVTEELKLIDTYSFGEPNPVPNLAGDSRIYPYFKFEGYEAEAVKKAWKVVTLENEYIKIFVLPEVGGKVWGAIEKKTGEEFLYKNEVLKFRNISMRGPWASGGIEFNFGIIGHTPATATPVDYLITKNKDGSVSCIVGTMDLPSRTRWSVEINLQKDKAYLETKASWYNTTALNQPYYNWMTAAAVATEDLEFFIPGNKYLEHSGKARSWPIDEEGRDLSYYKNNDFGPHKSYHIVGDYKTYFGGYYHDSQFGFGHLSSYDDMPGQKLWLWSQSRNGAIWEELLTDSDGQYIEFQAGRLFNQYEPELDVNPISQANFEPYTSDFWEEKWFPFKEIGGMVDANQYGVLNVEYEKQGMMIGINALQELDEELRVLVDGKQVYSTKVKLMPMEVFMEKIMLDSYSKLEVILGDRKLFFASDPENTLIKRPFVSDPSLEISKSQKLFSEGWEAMKGRAYKKAHEKFMELIYYDPSNIEALIKMTELEYRKTNYDEALMYINKALQIDTYHAGANYMAGVIYWTKNNAINSLESFGWAARSMEYRSASYAQMSEISFRVKDDDKAKKYADKALDFNTYNINARQVLLVLASRKKDKELVTSEATALLNIDPLNHFAVLELSKLDGSNCPDETQTLDIQNEFSEETIIELALQYQKLGLTTEAIEVLEMKENFTKVKLWLAFLMKDTDTNRSAGFLQDALQDKTDFVLPYRTETLTLLQWAVRQDQQWKLRYYLAQNYIAVGKQDAGLEILNNLADEPNESSVYRLRAKLHANDNYDATLKDHKKALQLSNEDWSIWNELIQFYLINDKQKNANKAASDAYKKFPDNYNIGLVFAKVLLLDQKYEKSIEVVSMLDVLPSEHGRLGREIYYDAHISFGFELMKSKEYSKAVLALENAKVWPEKLGVGKPYEVDTRLEDYLLATCLGKLGKESDKTELLNDIVKNTNQSVSQGDFNHLFGLLSLKDLGEKEALSLLISTLEGTKKRHLISSITLALAFYKKDEIILAKLKEEHLINDQLWIIVDSIMEN